ncbi:hypothetical protein [Mycoplasmopsis alligatoris]|uniref:Uncharacterized protein n=1 Tax=Mycoplasmopsis alligatoris A21JP2 TaxID=747682 RepID=D4XVP2_9BACT|nr:hypothetical protein [Mycoplasmopsis alligatoris]EFF41680.1 hypothetical protein MALL_0531 [Mycoplasmopsis alligatoris A21JP2]
MAKKSIIIGSLVGVGIVATGAMTAAITLLSKNKTQKKINFEEQNQSLFNLLEEGITKEIQNYKGMLPSENFYKSSTNEQLENILKIASLVPGSKVSVKNIDDATGRVTLEVDINGITYELEYTNFLRTSEAGSVFGKRLETIFNGRSVNLLKDALNDKEFVNKFLSYSNSEKKNFLLMNFATINQDDLIQTTLLNQFDKFENFNLKHKTDNIYNLTFDMNINNLKNSYSLDLNFIDEKTNQTQSFENLRIKLSQFNFLLAQPIVTEKDINFKDAIMFDTIKNAGFGDILAIQDKLFVGQVADYLSKNRNVLKIISISKNENIKDKYKAIIQVDAIDKVRYISVDLLQPKFNSEYFELRNSDWTLQKPIIRNGITSNDTYLAYPMLLKETINQWIKDVISPITLQKIDNNTNVELKRLTEIDKQLVLEVHFKKENRTIHFPLTGDKVSLFNTDENAVKFITLYKENTEFNNVNLNTLIEELKLVSNESNLVKDKQQFIKTLKKLLVSKDNNAELKELFDSFENLTKNNLLDNEKFDEMLVINAQKNTASIKLRFSFKYDGVLKNFNFVLNGTYIKPGSESEKPNNTTTSPKPNNTNPKPTLSPTEKDKKNAEISDSMNRDLDKLDWELKNPIVNSKREFGSNAITVDELKSKKGLELVNLLAKVLSPHTISFLKKIYPGTSTLAYTLTGVEVDNNFPNEPFRLFFRTHSLRDSQGKLRRYERDITLKGEFAKYYNNSETEFLILDFFDTKVKKQISGVKVDNLFINNYNTINSLNNNGLVYVELQKLFSSAIQKDLAAKIVELIKLGEEAKILSNFKVSRESNQNNRFEGRQFVKFTFRIKVGESTKDLEFNIFEGNFHL